MSQNHRYQYTRVIIQIKRVWLSVRFNCKLSFIIRNQLSQKLAEIDNTYNLFKGQCLVNQTIYFDLPAQVLANRCKKLKLIVMMISANGMVPAGFVNFNTCSKSLYEHYQVILPLQRCEDARAQIKFMHMYENCGKTSIQNSYINQLSSKQSRLSHLNDIRLSKFNKKNSQSVNRENFSNQKKYKDMNQNSLKVSFSRPLVSPRTLTKNIEGGKIDKQIKVSPFDKIDDKNIVQQQYLDSSINPLSRQQLMKQHQQYWLQIIRMQQQVQGLKQQNRKLVEQNLLLKNESQNIKQYYECHEQKIHAFVNENRQNNEIISRLKKQIEQYRQDIKNKEYIQIQYKKLIQKNNQNYHKQIDIQQIMRVFNQQKELAIHNKQMQDQKIIFLQNQTQKYSLSNLQLRQEKSILEEKIVYLSSTNHTQKSIIFELQKQILLLKNNEISLKKILEQKQQINILYDQLKSQHLSAQEKIYTLEKELLDYVQQKQSSIIENAKKDEQALEAISRSAQITKQLEELRGRVQDLRNRQLISQSNIMIYKKQLQLSSKQKQQLESQLSREKQDLQQIRGQLLVASEQNKLICLKMIEYEAGISGKQQRIQQLKQLLYCRQNEKIQLLQKYQDLQKQFNDLKARFEVQVSMVQNLQERCNKLLEEKQGVSLSNNEISQRYNLIKFESEGYKTQLEMIKRDNEYRQKQCNELRQQIKQLELQLDSTLELLQENKKYKNSTQDLYKQSYNTSMTALTLKNGKLQRQLQQISQKFDSEKKISQQLSQKLSQKNIETTQLKHFTQNKLKQTIKYSRENEELKQKIKQYINILQDKQALIIRLSEMNQQIEQINRQNIIRIDQLQNELKFVTQVLQRQRQQKSEIQKQIDHLQKIQLPQINQSSNITEQSIDDKQQDVNLEIQSKVIPIQKQKDQKIEVNKKKKKKR